MAKRSRKNTGGIERRGVETSEYAVARLAGWLGLAGLVLGALAMAAGTVLDALELGGRQAVVAGAIVAGISSLAASLSSIGYSYSRGEVKSAEGALRAWELQKETKDEGNG